MTKDEWPRYHLVAGQKIHIFQPNELGSPQSHLELAQRIDYLESVCAGINAYRGEDD